MKKQFAYWFILFVPLLFLTACGDDDDDPVTLEGTWVLQRQELNVLVNGIPISQEQLNAFGIDLSDLEIPEGSSLTFESGGVLQLNASGEPSATGTWSLSADQQTLTLSQGGETLTFEVLELSANNLNIKLTETEQIEEGGFPINVTIELTWFSTRQ